jgi:monoamine oxidase
LIKALEHAVKRRKGVLQKGVTVTRIDQGPDGVEVYAEGKPKPYAADFCVCTTPTHCLRRLQWKPALPLEQQNAASQVQYSRIMKTAVLYANRFWPDRKRSGFSVFTGRVSDFCFDSSYRQKGRYGILCSYAIGDKADDLASEPNENNVIKWITEDVASAVQPPPSTRVAPIKIKRQPWQREKWIGGAYAFYRPGQWFVIRRILQRPHGRVNFAGEHLSEDWQGFMEGAVETGETAADALIEFAS